MVEITNNFRTKHAKAVRKVRTEKFRVVRLEVDLYYCARKDPGHGRYIVKFFHRGKTVTAVCATLYNEACKGCWQGRCCAHIAACVERGIKLGRQKEKRAVA